MNNESSITQVLRISILLLVLGWCFFIIKPFLIIVIWAIILAVAFYPLYTKWVQKIGVTKKFATVLFTLLIALLLLIPTYFILSSVFESTAVTVDQIKNNELQIPLPDEKVKSWPLVGEKVYTEWHDISEDFKKYAQLHKEVLLDYGVEFVSGVSGFIGTLAAFLISFLIAVVFMYHADSGYRAAILLFKKLVGNDNEEVVHMSRDTIRSVVKGILLVALIQSGLAFIGFKAIGLPAAGIFTLLVLVTAIVQIPAILTMIPAILIAFSMAEPTYAIIFSIYRVHVGLSDNFLKPMLLGKGLKTPMIVILIGTIGGMLLHGIIGLFVGAVVLAVMYRMYEYWVNSPIKND
ncbi:MAG: AI-2E family transporter [Maribacter sp.]|nr:AI-2E family transporter [Maribacter sp.]